MRRLLIVVPCVVLLASCGMSVGLRPLPESNSTATTAPSVPPEPVVAAAGAVTPSPGDPAPDISTTVPTVPVTTSTSAGAATTVPAESPSTTGSPEETTTSTTVAATTTSSSPVETTTTTAEPPPTSVVSLPDLPDIGTVFTEDGAFVTHDCAGGDVTIKSEAGTFTLQGTCRAILVTGSFNTVFVDEVSAIDLTGQLNAVVYAAGTPVVNDWEGSNIVTGG